ncbi:MAG: hypothetical protein ACTHKE_04345 [Sphingomicrobium sp.]
MGRPLGTDTVTVLRAGTTIDPYSQLATAGDWDHPTSWDVRGCDFQPGASSEQLIGRDFSEIGGTVFAPIGTDVTEYDRVSFQGTVYDVDGKPEVWPGRMGYVGVHLKVRKG